MNTNTKRKIGFLAAGCFLLFLGGCGVKQASKPVNSGPIKISSESSAENSSEQSSATQVNQEEISKIEDVIRNVPYGKEYAKPIEEWNSAKTTSADAQAGNPAWLYTYGDYSMIVGDVSNILIWSQLYYDGFSVVDKNGIYKVTFNYHVNPDEVAGKIKETVEKNPGIPPDTFLNVFKNIISKAQTTYEEHILPFLKNQTGLENIQLVVNTENADKLYMPETQDLGQWANVYQFYHQQSGQHQGTLTISPTGAVVQVQMLPDSRTFYGQATILSDTPSEKLSYDIKSVYGSSKELPETKRIIPSVHIQVVWDDDGGVDDYYGYITSNGQFALTDGIAFDKGVNEVWVCPK